MKADELKTDIPSAVQPNTKDTQDLVINRTQPEMAAQPDDLPDPFDTDSDVESLSESKALAKRSRKKAGADAIAQETGYTAQFRRECNGYQCKLWTICYQI